MAERQTGSKVQYPQSDGGGESLGEKITLFLKKRGIVKRISCAVTPPENGVTERMNRTILNTARALLYQKIVPKEFWGDAVAIARYIRNRITCVEFPANKTSFEMWAERKSDLGVLRVFGYPCWYHMRTVRLK